MAASWRFLILLIAGMALLSCVRSEGEDEDEGESFDLSADESGDLPEDFGDAAEHEDKRPFTKEELDVMHGLLDADKDGKASLAEMVAYWMKMRTEQSKVDIKDALDDMDEDKDGKISEKEAVKTFDEGALEEGVSKEQLEEVANSWFMKERIELDKRKFSAADKNKDGFLNEEELPLFLNPEIDDEVLDAANKHTLESKDADKDGLLNLTEFFFGEPLRHLGELEEGSHERLPDEDIELFHKMDKNGDGKLDFHELRPRESGVMHVQEAMEGLIALADRDKDGHLTLEEMHDTRRPQAEISAQMHLRDYHRHHRISIGELKWHEL
eukprot:gnl/TRDRNA2_/TRDRNA2_189517_c0_seq1.p1 gnl/TRDRNA2_/TRDRNA2_189517_c0~~gnl/TRDRNA2_/TRDRNA2_189517_c0_seq1.p1  ORF type:complete len:326 (-),score=83.57 gnl/TRDRNA2_/TRDRNA2_189517_c0_seq1:85-1062(-)